MMYFFEEEKKKLVLPESLYREIEKNIADLYEEYGIVELPIDPYKIVEKMGYELVEINENNEFYSLMIAKEIDALTVETNEEKKIIYRNDQKEGRIKFSIAHEIGHIRMGHREESMLANKIANHYAAYLLVPEVLIYCCKCDDYFDISEIFDVTLECAMNCFDSYQNWMMFSSYRAYEKRIISQFGFSK